MTNHIRENLEYIREEITGAEKTANRPLGTVKLLAVSKTFPSEDILAAYNCGQRIFGENKVQELEKKVPRLPKDIEWHLIGHLQSNKVAKAVELADYIHSVDSEKLLVKIERMAKEKNRKPKILLEVNVSEEESKFGLDTKDVESCVTAALKCHNLELVGLMTMAPYETNKTELTRIFSTLMTERNQLEQKFRIKLPELSMGMSSDFKIAITDGATIVRVGTLIFGKRNYKQECRDLT